jgi:hypothetical protein
MECWRNARSKKINQTVLFFPILQYSITPSLHFHNGDLRIHNSTYFFKRFSSHYQRQRSSRKKIDHGKRVL